MTAGIGDLSGLRLDRAGAGACGAPPCGCGEAGAAAGFAGAGCAFGFAAALFGAAFAAGFLPPGFVFLAVFGFFFAIGLMLLGRNAGIMRETRYRRNPSATEDTENTEEKGVITKDHKGRTKEGQWGYKNAGIERRDHAKQARSATG
jgi:hypothetical protein